MCIDIECVVWYPRIMAQRKRKLRSFTLPESFMERMAEVARRRDIPMSRLVQEYGQEGLNLDEELIRLVDSGRVGDVGVEELREISWLVSLIRKRIHATDADEYQEASEALEEALDELLESRM